MFQFDLQLVNNIYSVMTKDSLLTSHAISTPINDPDDIPQFFDSISYDKVSYVLMHKNQVFTWYSSFRFGATAFHLQEPRNKPFVELCPNGFLVSNMNL